MTYDIKSLKNQGFSLSSEDTFLKNHRPLLAILGLRLAGNLTVDDNGLFCNLAIMFVNR